MAQQPLDDQAQAPASDIAQPELPPQSNRVALKQVKTSVMDYFCGAVLNLFSCCRKKKAPIEPALIKSDVPATNANPVEERLTRIAKDVEVITKELREVTKELREVAKRLDNVERQLARSGNENIESLHG